ncbi:MAG TPA: isoprenylcysteine carboxylmethyltransferase family protein [Candidatus Sulfotelmatobacter sp.]|nr:isoprenylcysteine carboxylmethyltransferase family protein [Candidatus Sulfotelmatobacter sp.]
MQRRRSGSSGWVHGWGVNRAERLANLLFIGACVADAAAPALVLAGVLTPIGVVDVLAAHLAGLALLALSLPAALLVQRAMGGAWRTGIDPRFMTPLVTQGPFAVVRNPFYSITFMASAGVALLVPTVLAPLSLGLCFAAVETITRFVEEPFLLSRHGSAYRAYAASVGRFFPTVGRLRLG